ncbi:MAG: 4-hydroxyphenylacetate decarboxylase small subunit [Bacteroidales bacterium]|nr:4-hydroxyphenylacetate decarboxylase small subunit [Bacteroidales bacterium]
MELSCKDCTFYLPVDVFQGLCKISKAKILPDDAFCREAGKLPKCKFCHHFTEEKDYLGKCKGTTLAYHDMVASKCADFEWIQQN